MWEDPEVHGGSTSSGIPGMSFVRMRQKPLNQHLQQLQPIRKLQILHNLTQVEVHSESNTKFTSTQNERQRINATKRLEGNLQEDKRRDDRQLLASRTSKFMAH